MKSKHYVTDCLYAHILLCNGHISLQILKTNVIQTSVRLFLPPIFKRNLSLDFDDTYDEYVFKFYDIHPSANAKSLTFQTDTGTNTNYNIACTTSAIKAYHNEPDNYVELGYDTQYDAAQSTSFINLAEEIMNNNDSSVSGTLTVFNPSSSTFVKHFISDMQGMRNDVYSWRFMKGGYFNTTTALTRFQFKLNSGNIDSGVIKLYGIS